MKKALKWIAQNPMEIIAAVALSASVLISVINGLTRYFIKYTWNPGTDVNPVLCLCGFLRLCRGLPSEDALRNRRACQQVPGEGKEDD